MIKDPMFVFAAVLGLYCGVWALYGMIHLKVPRQGVGALGWTAVAVILLASVFFFGYSFFAPESEGIAGLPHF